MVSNLILPLLLLNPQLLIIDQKLTIYMGNLEDMKENKVFLSQTRRISAGFL